MTNDLRLMPAGSGTYGTAEIPPIGPRTLNASYVVRYAEPDAMQAVIVESPDLPNIERDGADSEIQPGRR